MSGQRLGLGTKAEGCFKKTMSDVSVGGQLVTQTLG